MSRREGNRSKVSTFNFVPLGIVNDRVRHVTLVSGKTLRRLSFPVLLIFREWLLALLTFVHHRTSSDVRETKGRQSELFMFCVYFQFHLF
jgi:hypothetical protein